ncbi:MAG: hypothetical protein WCI39_06200 [Gallionellaceae bacterium]
MTGGEYKSEKEATATLADIEKYVRFWIEEEYHQRIHSGTSRAPIMHWKEETANLPQGLTDVDVDVLARTPNLFRRADIENIDLESLRIMERYPTNAGRKGKEKE